MTSPQLVRSALVLMAIGAVGCSRAETQQQTGRAAAEVRQAAEVAGDRLADSWITSKIQARYFADDQIKARYIDVTTRDGVTTVKGYVESPASRERALQIARTTDGVRQVNDQLLIGQSPADLERSGVQGAVATAGDRVEQTATTAAAKLDDARVTTSVQARFFLDSLVKARRINVDTRGGVVTLSGEVASEAERSQALLLARTTQGVQRVEDHLTVNASLQ